MQKVIMNKVCKGGTALCQLGNAQNTILLLQEIVEKYVNMRKTYNYVFVDVEGSIL